MKKPVRKTPVKPMKETKYTVSNSTIEFARTHDMITKQEYEAARMGNAKVSAGAKTIMNLNAPLPNFPTGTKQELYPGRGSIVTTKNFLEM